MEKAPFEEDQELASYLEEVGLSELDLTTIDLKSQERAEATWHVFRIVCALVVGALGVSFSSTSWYALHTEAPWLLTALGVACVWLLFRPVIELWRERARVANMRLEVPGALRRANLDALPSLPSWSRAPGVSRILMFSLALCGAAYLLFAMPRQAEWAGQSYSATWFVAVFVAITTGILVGRLVIAQAESSPPTSQRDQTPLSLPSWLKWINLAVLTAGALLASYGEALFGETGFVRAGIGLVTGICGAIWISRRFDEWQVQIETQAAEQARAQAVRATELEGTFD